MDPIRKTFEEVTYPSFGVASSYTLERTKNGQYVNGIVEDHWQTFQEGWEEAIKWLQNKNNSCYTDIVSNGGIDPRNG